MKPRIAASPRATRRRLAPAQATAGGFVLTILLGALLLTLPASSAQGRWTDPIAALFTATSATCVTGLADAHVRAEHGVTVAAYRSERGDWSNASPETVLSPGDTMLVVGPINRVERFAQLR